MALIRTNLPTHLRMMMGRTLPGPSDAAQDKTGAGQRIYIVDTPVDPEMNNPGEQLAGRLTMGPNFLPTVPGNHGTGMALLAAGQDYGLAVDARVISVGAAAPNGNDSTGSTDSFRAAFQWIAEQESLPAHPTCAVVCVASSIDGSIDPEVTAMVAAGCVVVAAAGENNLSGLPSPASNPSVLAVAGCTAAGVKIDASRWALDRFRQVFAFGAGINVRGVGGQTFNFDGTSSAAPQVAGLAALWCEAAGWYGDALHIVDAISANATAGVVTVPQGVNPRLAYAGWRITGPWTDNGYKWANPDIRPPAWPEGRTVLEHFTEFGGAVEGRGKVEDGN